MRISDWSSDVCSSDLTSSVFHLMRNLGSSLFISLSVTTVVRSGNANYSRMTEFASPYHEPIARGVAEDRWTLETAEGLARLSREIGRQASMLAYLNALDRKSTRLNSSH